MRFVTPGPGTYIPPSDFGYIKRSPIKDATPRMTQEGSVRHGSIKPLQRTVKNSSSNLASGGRAAGGSSQKYQINLRNNLFGRNFSQSISKHELNMSTQGSNKFIKTVVSPKNLGKQTSDQGESFDQNSTKGSVNNNFIPQSYKALNIDHHQGKTPFKVRGEQRQNLSNHQIFFKTTSDLQNLGPHNNH
mmetsp:Transcript_3257/g.5407  ORF Transcript_3257/g.5407 Transcript_3257/m.5407 type:complete len:189 (-) Transcript_3257:67-633(-)